MSIGLLDFVTILAATAALPMVAAAGWVAGTVLMRRYLHLPSDAVQTLIISTVKAAEKQDISRVGDSDSAGQETVANAFTQGQAGVKERGHGAIA